MCLRRKELVEIKGAAEIDTGDPRQGEKYNRIWEIKCPACHGTFFDAGEFKEFCEETFMDHIKDWFAKKD